VKIAALNMCSPEVPTLEQVRTQFPMSKRSFQRRLAAENCAFRDIANDIKRKLYEYLKMGESYKVQDIAYILGYTDASALLHAKSNWESNQN
jgi:AraC-like DNA-binding protein